MAAYANGDVTLENDTVFAGILAGIEQLPMQKVLDIAIVGKTLMAFAVRGTELPDFVGVVGRQFGPCVKVCSVVFVAQDTESGIGNQPVFVLFVEVLVLLGLHHFFAFFAEGKAEVVALGLVHTFVVNLAQSVELPEGLLIFLLFGGVGKGAYLAQVDKHGVESIDGNGLVGVGVYPASCHSGVVDGQNLQRALTGLYGPVNHLLQIAKVAYTLAAFSTKREYGHCCAGNLLQSRGQIKFAFGSIVVYMLVELRNIEATVFAFLPFHDGTLAGVDSHEFVFAVSLKLVEVKGKFPLVGKDLRKNEWLFPFSKAFASAHDSQFQPFLMEAGTEHTERDAAQWRRTFRCRSPVNLEIAAEG